MSNLSFTEQSGAGESKPSTGGFSFKTTELCTAASKPSRTGLFANPLQKKECTERCSNKCFPAALQSKANPVKYSFASKKHFDFINYFKYDDRIFTFKNLWPKTHSMKAEDLAKAGFVYTGEGEKVSCPWCNIILTDWDPFDEAFAEHRRHSPHCDFILMLFPSCSEVLFNF